MGTPSDNRFYRASAPTTLPPEPAFPSHGSMGEVVERGMDLRDYFAAKALAGIMANPERWKQIASDYTSGKKTYEECSAANAVKAYSLADAMLKARQS